MPYNNLPESDWAKMDRCVDDVMAQGHDKEGAIRICYTSISEGKELDAVLAEQKATAEDNNLPDSAFLYVESGGDKDGEGKTVPRSLRHLPYKTASGALDLPRLRNALSRLGQSDTGTTGGEKWLTASLRDKLIAKARGILEQSTKESALAVYKQSNGKYRWIMVTSSSFKDRDGQIVSQQALEDDTAAMNKLRNFGGIDWWHLYKLDGKLVSGRDLTTAELERAQPISLGACDFSAMHDLASIESGIFDSDFVGQRFAECQNDLACSRSFLHPVTEPDAEGVYHHIATFSRAILPRGNESNPITRFYAAKEKSMSMIMDKIKELVTKLGGDEVAVKEVEKILGASSADQQALLSANVAHKDEQLPVAPAAPEAPVKKDESEFVAALTANEFTTLLVGAMKAALDPMVAEIKALGESQKPALKEMGTGIVAEIAKVAQAQAVLDARLKNLEGETPRAFRASQSPTTVVPADSALKEKRPGPDSNAPYLTTFIGNLLGASGQPPAQ